MKRLVLFVMIIAGYLGESLCQTADPVWGIKFSGFAKNDIFYDTRQSSAANGLREGHFYLYPDNKYFDGAGNDLNLNSSLHFLSIQTRIRGDISAPEAFGAKTSGAIEAEFFGTSEADLNGFRLRHAYVKLDWPKVSLLSGQFWHPMFTAESFPGTISFNTGAPFIPFSRNPQLRLTGLLGKASVSLTAYGQRDFTSPGPAGNSNRYLRNSTIPGLNLLLKIPAGSNVTGWLGVDYKNIRPELVTAMNYESNERVSGISAFANLRIITAPVNISMMGVYGENPADLMMIGGYAVKSTNPANGISEYTTINTGNFWIDLTTKGTRTSFGLFSGYSKNLGASDIITGDVYGRGTNIDHIFRVSPRVTVTEGKLSIAGELEHTTAAYGTRQADGKVADASKVSNLRVLLSTIYRF